MKILIQVHALTGGGAERVAVSWANGLSRIGHEVIILTDLKQPITYQPEQGIKLLQRNYYSPKCKNILGKISSLLFSPIKMFLQYRRIFRETHPDAVISVLYLNHRMMLLARLFSREKFPIIMTDHNVYEYPKGLRMPFKKWIHKFIDNRFFDIVTVLTKRDKEIIERHRIKNSTVLYNPLFLTPVTEVPKREKIVMACGRLNVWHCKGFDVLLKAWGRIEKDFPEWRLRIIGKGDDKIVSDLKGKVGKELYRVEFLPYTNNMLQEYRKSEVFVLSSRYEAWGLVMVEAMSQGCAVIACDFKGRQSEVISDRENGILCEPDNINQLEEKIREILNNNKMRKKLQKNALLSVDKYSEDKVAKELEKILIQAKNK